jgi:hypothetical protein
MPMTEGRQGIDLTLEPRGAEKNRFHRIEVRLEKDIAKKLEIIKEHANTSKNKVINKSLNEFCNAYITLHNLTVKESVEPATATTNSQ